MPPDEPAGRPPSQAASPQRPRPQLPRRARAPAPGPPAGLAPRADSERKTLTVPRSISFSGWIGSRERLMVEGAVETEIHACRFLTVAASGVFRGSADVERADVSGTVEGFLTARELLTVRASGRILGGSISYGELEIQRGGVGRSPELFGRFRRMLNRRPLPTRLHSPAALRGAPATVRWRYVGTATTPVPYLYSKPPG